MREKLVAFIVGISGFVGAALPGSAQAPMQAAVPAKAIVRLDPRLDLLIDPNAKLEIVSADFAKADSPATEGPVWIEDTKSPDGGYFVFTDSRRTQLSRWSPGTGLAQAYDLKKMLGTLDPERSPSSGLAVDPQGRIVFCSSGRHAVVRIEKDGRPTILAEKYNGKTLNNPNDITIAKNGTIFFTDNSRDESGLMPPTVYRIKDGKISAVVSGLQGPNGITLSPDNKILYVNDIRRRMVFRYDVGPEDNISNERLFIDMSNDKAEGANDGMRTDSRGNLYDSGPGGVWIISPDGKHLGTILTPDRISNLSFGGSDGRTLFLTGRASVMSIGVKTGG
jgi:gluconolactonase